MSIPVPAADLVPAGPERAVSVAHAAQEVLSDIAHASRHAGAVAAARKAGNQERVRFNLLHVSNHVGGAIVQQNSSISNLVQLDPKSGAELARLRDTAGRSSWQYAPPGPARHKTPAHLASTVLVALTHSREHVVACQQAPDDENLAFDLEHLTKHIEEAHSHQRKYVGAVSEFFPAVAAELAALGALADTGRGVPAGARSALLDRCDTCGEPKVPGRPCDDEQCPGSAGDPDPGERARDRAYERTMAEFAALSRWEGPV
jgi:hypothetical protein